MARILGTVLLLCTLASTAPAFPVKRCVNLSNALEATGPEGWWGYKIRQDHLKKIAAAGFDTVRVPIRFSLKWDDGIDPTLLARVDEVVSQARAVGLQVIIDLHHFEELNADFAAHEDMFVAIWDELAEHFADADAGVIFELLNEPGYAISTEQIVPLYDRALARIRAHHPTRWVIIGGGYYSGYVEMLQLPESGAYTAHTFHYYGPFDFTHQQQDWMEKPLPVKDWGTEAEHRQVRSHFDDVAQHPTPMFLGEFGVAYQAPSASRNAWLETVRANAEERGIGWCVWGFAVNFRIYDQEMDDWDTGALRALIPR